MFKLLAAVVLLGTAANAFPSSLMPDGRIVGGEPRYIYVFQSSIRLSDRDRNRPHRCSGALISPTWVLAPAHCLDALLIVALATVNVGSDYMSSGGTEFDILQVVIHPSYSSVNNDIALIQLATSVSLGANVTVATLPSQGYDPAAGVSISITGWERAADAALLGLQVVVTDVISRTQCQTAYGSMITENMFCAGGLDACMGDSGAPAVVNGTLVGFASWGVGCANSDYPGVYTNVGMYRSWITQITGI